MDIINEFSSGDDDHGGGDNNGLILVSNIIWDTDEEGLPTRVTIPMDDLDNVTFPSEHYDEGDNMMTRIGDWLTDRIHASLSDFDYQVI